MRRAAITRDGGICQTCGKLCTGKGQQPNAPVGDHITPHKGIWARFIDPANVQCLCKACHDRHKQQLEAQGYGYGSDDTGWPDDPRHPSNRVA